MIEMKPPIISYFFIFSLKKIIEIGIINMGLIEDIVAAIDALECLNASTRDAIPKIDVTVPQKIKNKFFIFFVAETSSLPFF